jgi:hypothetical protein
MQTLVDEEIKKPSFHNDGSSRSAWFEEGIPLLLSSMTCRWEIGDWALRTPAEASRAEVKELLEEAAARTGYEVNSLRDLRTVAERIPPELRKQGLSWYGHKAISRLIVSDNGRVNEDKSLALRADFIEKFASEPDAIVDDIRSAVRTRMGKSAGQGKMQTVSFKLTAEDYARLKSIVEADPTHETVSNIVQEIVLDFIREKEASL